MRNFRRLTWVDDEAKATWKPRLEAVRQWIVHREVFEPMKPMDVPACCAAAVRQCYPDESSVQDTIARHNESGVPHPIIQLDTHPILNVLLRPLGIYLFRHHLCSFDCAATTAMYEGIFQQYLETPDRPEARWLAEMLSWPVQYSALHGIAEVHTPVFKLIVPTRPSLGKHTVRLNGTLVPEHAAKGVHFPYRLPRKKTVTDSRGFKNGLQSIA
ncbi:MAG: hypothetical protein AAF570_27505 [Bacteroidota bacterium]